MQPAEQSLETHQAPFRVPLVVGVSGHVDIGNPEFVKEKLQLFWDTIRGSVGKDAPIILLTSIAKGADHLAAISCPENVRYCVVLPFAEAEYRKDFTEPPQALEDFENDLRGAYRVIACEAEPGDYAAASDYVREHCDILLTMWDGWESLEKTKPEDSTSERKSLQRKPARGGTYYQIRAAFGLDDLTQHREKKHLVVNIAVARSDKGLAYHRMNNEKPICDFSKGSGLSLLSWNEGRQEMEFFSDFSERTTDFLQREVMRSGKALPANEMISEIVTMQTSGREPKVR